MQTDPNFNREEWEQSLLAAREETRGYYLNEFNWRGASLPGGFDGPRYYPPNEEWRVPARLDRSVQGTSAHVHLETSVGDLREFEVYGTFVFQAAGQEQRLTAYRAVPPHPGFDELFVPFKDATTGKETYGAGRYLDVPRLDDGTEDYVLDFNTAYNPLCAYSPRYNCPYPPPQNRLQVRVEAGEMTPTPTADL